MLFVCKIDRWKTNLDGDRHVNLLRILYKYRSIKKYILNFKKYMKK